MKIFQLLMSFTVLVFYDGTVQAGTLVEDFTSLNSADLQVSTGIWNIVDHSARSQAFANGAVDATRPINFGNGSDGIVNSATGFTFDTNAHASGYNFQSLNISAGAITVTGAHPLIIRSLSTINIVPILSVNGANGNIGSVTGTANPGLAATTCLATGGAGGSAIIAAGSNAGDGVQSGGTTEVGNHGLGETGVYGAGAVTQANLDGQGSLTGPGSNDFETAPALNFIGGTSGPGGGGYSDGAVNFASGGAGGAGGGIIKIASVGDLTLAAGQAEGGNGGDGAAVDAGCSGNGSGGNGGVIFLQTLGTLTTTAIPNVSGGNSGVACAGGSGAAFSGVDRGDTLSTSVRPAWATAAPSFDTEIVPALLTSFVQSTSYNLGTLNAGFTAPTLTVVAPAAGSSVAVTFSGSVDGVTFSAFTADVTTLSNLGYRFLKFRATFTNPTVAGVAPKITLVSIPFSELGLTKLNVNLSPGCGTIQNRSGRKSNPESDIAGGVSTFLWLMFWMLFRQVIRTSPSKV